jgi:hypothetical protein
MRVLLIAAAVALANGTVIEPEPEPQPEIPVGVLANDYTIETNSYVNTFVNRSTAMDSSSGTDVVSVAGIYFNNLLITVGNVCSRSSNYGSSWSTITSLNNLLSSNSTTATAIARNETMVVTVGGNGFCAYSTDGINWTQSNSFKTVSGSIDITGVKWLGDRWCAVGYDRMLFSTDGINWTVSKSLFAAAGGTPISWYAFGYNGSALVASSSTKSAVSYDKGATWIVRNQLTSFTPYGVTYDPVNSRWWAVGSGNKVAVSTNNGNTWTISTVLSAIVGTSGVTRAIVADGTRVIIATDTNKRFVVSTSGMTLSEKTTYPNFSADPARCIIRMPNRMLAIVGANNQCTVTSS